MIQKLLIAALFMGLAGVQSLFASEHLDMKTLKSPASLDAYRDVQVKDCSGNCPDGNGTWSVVANTSYDSQGETFVAFLLTTNTWYEAKVLQPFGNECKQAGSSTWYATVSSGSSECSSH